MTVSMNACFEGPGSLRAGTIGLTLALFVSSADATSSCPTVITTPAGSAFDVASLISDNGSPQAALAKLRTMLSKLGGGARCKLLRDVVACNETVELAKRAAVALEACAGSAPPGPSVDRRDQKRPDRRESAELSR
ncbi:hypothetical protein C8K18_107165 [Paraburkholderia sp. GV068]|jgi:hypothetical protein|uniref:UrcA family protein n=1 Tax=Paraburkholderia graminis TaxID=60548 RepID=A0ABD5CPE6_9BURK|nr:MULTISPECIES: hypothetical protein [Paraburkholderia]ALE54409.1 hypothetical protein AC233_06545 [Burkholderia sp. HB1]MBW8833709.1 hypothetical protein [Burkholderia sp.]AXF07711.1 hypothetical protein CUJ91_07060 [Paraburkholderia graminis]MDR6207132.1 hypothetical protein [Paraburkholderia graminis]MDR6466448.1 hypothetical protein [Paraburkholderia graminis]